MKPLRAIFAGCSCPDLLSGLDQSDDAAVYKVSDEKAIILTTDYFTPIVDDPYRYGAIAAANSMSDVFAMGGEVMMALNIAGFPELMPEDVIIDILRGGGEKVKEADAVIAGGHTIDSKEPFYGLAVCGIVHPLEIMEKSGANPGDKLVLTKPLGTGIISTALKGDQALSEHVDKAGRWMMDLNREASRAARQARCRCATDITGFGMIGHSLEIAVHSGVALHLSYSNLPFLDGTLNYAEQWLFPAGANRNRNAYMASVNFDSSLSEENRMLLYTPETSGGLLLVIKPEKLDGFVSDCSRRHQAAWIVGEVLAGDPCIVIVP
ncbi:selenide, water dikinase SelD [bacterium]|nr:selenide, water dikinase SelD [candidate division CSSED10-310 bacterium]